MKMTIEEQMDNYIFCFKPNNYIPVPMHRMADANQLLDADGKYRGLQVVPLGLHNLSIAENLRG